MSLVNRLVVVLTTCGVALIVAGVIVGKPVVGLEGAYFDRANGVPAFAGVFTHTGTGLLDPSDGNLWIGAGISFVVAAMAVLILTRIERTGRGQSQ